MCLTNDRGANYMNIHYDVTGLLTVQYSSFVTYMSRQAATRHGKMIALHGWNRNLDKPVARPVTTSCSDLPRRLVLPDRSRHFVHTFFTNKLHLVAICCDGKYGWTTSGNLYTIWLRCVNIIPAMPGRPNMVRQAYTIRDLSGRCSDHAMSRQPHNVVPMSCHS